MRVKKEVEAIRDFLACLVKVEAMRAANDCRHHLNLPPVYPTENFKNLVKYVQAIENSIVDGTFKGFTKKLAAIKLKEAGK